MQVWRGLEQVPAGLRSVVTLGIFDGVHRGHQRILATCMREAKRANAMPVAVTFHPHPASLHRPEENLQLITDLDDRLAGIAQQGVAATCLLEYNWDLARLSAQEFVELYFVQALGAASVVIGSDVRFGRNNEGDLRRLIEIGGQAGFDVIDVPDYASDHGRRFSSSWVRECLASGDVRGAARIMGHNHVVRGVVVHGEKRGRELGFPTANLNADGIGVIPADGVYAGYLRVPAPAAGQGEGDSPGVGADSTLSHEGEQLLPAAISVGTNPQFAAQKRTVEAHVLGRADLDLYGQRVGVELVQRLRGMHKFSDVEELLLQMDDDLLQTSRILNVPQASRVDAKLVTAGA